MKAGKVHHKTALAATKLRVVEGQQEKFCPRCNEWWPADAEFFNADAKRVAGLFYCCRACSKDLRADYEAKKAAAKASRSAPAR